MKSTGINWTDDTTNPTSGCDGCELWIPGRGGPCYAGTLHETRLAKSLPTLYDPDFRNVRLIPGRMAKAVRCMDLANQERPKKPWLNGHRRKIFVGDLGDIFSSAVPFEYLKSEIIDIALSQNGLRHDLQLLTKQPQRAAEFAAWLRDRGVPWPDNVWVGTSITSGNTAKSRIGHLAKIPARNKYLSLEPLVGEPGLTKELVSGVINWMIIGGESHQGSLLARPFDLKWAYDCIGLGRECGIAVFVK